MPLYRFLLLVGESFTANVKPHAWDRCIESELYQDLISRDVTFLEATSEHI